MKLGSGYPTIETLAAVIAHSQIVVAQPHSPMRALPAGFEDLDIAVLDWIAVEGRRPDRGSSDMGRAVSASRSRPSPKRSPTSISGRSRGEARRPSCLPAARPGASPPTSPSWRSY